MSATRAQVAIACNVTERHVSRLVAEGSLPRDSRGQYDLGRCMMAYIKYLQAAVAARSTTDAEGRITSTAGQRAKLLDVEVHIQEIALAKARSEIISIADHEAILSALVIETKAALMAVGPRVSQYCVGVQSRSAIQALIDGGVKEALHALARALPSKLLSAIVRPRRRPRPAA